MPTIPDTIEKTPRMVFDEIMGEMAKLRQQGRTVAWAHLEEKVMLNSGFLIEQGFMSFKDVTATLIEIEQFRKSEAGTQQLPGDFMMKWLNGEEAPVGR